MIATGVSDHYFDKGKREVSGSSGCNTYFASYEIDGNNLSISDLALVGRAG